MKRRDFVKTGMCIGCAGVLGIDLPIFNNKVCAKTLPQEKFIYKSEDELPKKIRLDICNLCQLNCPACWIRKDEQEIIKSGGGFGYVPFETFKEFVDKHPFIKEIEMSHDGEVFLNPDLEDIIKYAYEKNITLTAYNGVNFNTVSKSVLEALVKYKVQGFTISIDGTTPDVYATYRRGGNFKTVIKNIKTLNKYKKQYNSEYPYLTLKFVIFGHNEHQIEDAKKLAEDLNMGIYFALNIDNEYSPLKNPDRVYELTGLRDQTNKKENCVEKDFEKYKEDQDEWFSCKDLWESPQINWNGDLFGCCCTAFPFFDTNVFKDGLLKSMNSEKILYAKAMLTDFSVKPKEGILCTHCWVYDLIKRTNMPLRGV